VEPPSTVLRIAPWLPTAIPVVASAKEMPESPADVPLVLFVWGRTRVVPVQLIQALPYVLTVGLLAGFVGRAVAPRAIGVPYVKER